MLLGFGCVQLTCSTTGMFLWSGTFLISSLFLIRLITFGILGIGDEVKKFYEYQIFVFSFRDNKKDFYSKINLWINDQLHLDITHQSDFIIETEIDNLSTVYLNIVKEYMRGNFFFCFFIFLWRIFLDKESVFILSFSSPNQVSKCFSHWEVENSINQSKKEICL